MKRINQGFGCFDLHYDNEDMSLSMRLLKCRLGQFLEENGHRDLYLKNASFVYFNKSGWGGDSGWRFCVPRNSNSRDIREFHLDGSIKEFYKNGIEIFYEDDHICKRLIQDKKTICKVCKGKKYVRDDAWGYMETCKSCNSDYIFPYNI